MTGGAAEHGAAVAASGKARRRPVAGLLRALAVGVVAVVAVAGTVGAYCGAIIYEGNFRTVESGVLYRSAQLDQAALEGFARHYGIKSVLNLRGAHAGAPWYESEMAAVRELGLKHYDYPISAKRFVSGAQIAQILDIVREAPKPLLVHCQSGADRSGLVAALYEYAVRHAAAEQADQQLSLAYGHFPYLTSKSGAMDASFWAYVRGTAQTAANN